MAKTEETIKLEKDIFKATQKQGIFGCFEVTIGFGGYCLEMKTRKELIKGNTTNSLIKSLDCSMWMGIYIILLVLIQIQIML